MGFNNKPRVDHSIIINDVFALQRKSGDNAANEER